MFSRYFDHGIVLLLYELCIENPTATVINNAGQNRNKSRPFPLDTKTLQKISSRFLRMQSDITMKVAESLYQKGLTSYPRTETNKFPANFNLREKIQMQCNSEVWGEYCQQLMNGNLFNDPKAGPLVRCPF